MSSINSLYLLTQMTGRTSGSDRTTVIGTVEMKWRTFWISVIAMVPASVLTAIFYPMLQSWSFLWMPLVLGSAFTLVERRSREGLRLRTYQTLFDKKRSNTNQFFLCGQPITVAGDGFGTIRQITAPVPGAPGGHDAEPADTHEDFEAFTR